MSSATNIILIGIGLLFMYGVGVFALYLNAGENKISAALAASGWWLAFSASQVLCYLAISMH